MGNKEIAQDTPSDDESKAIPNEKDIIGNNNINIATENVHLVDAFFRNLSNFETHISSTGTQIGSTLGTINELSESIKDWNRKAIVGLQPGLDDYFTQRIEPIKNELESKLQETKKSLSSMNDFIRDSESALKSLFSVQGKMSGLESQMTSVLSRLTKLEEDRNIHWNKATAIISIIIAVISTAIATYLALVK